MTTSFNNKALNGNAQRLAKNTVILYLRQLVCMAITLYSSRLILQYLGSSDFGIYNVVGGMVAMLSLLSGSLSVSVSRQLTYELERSDLKRLRQVFAMSINVQVMMSAVVLVVAEVVGVWFLNNKMVIPNDRLVAANWVLQFSIITFVVNLLAVPYNAAIIAHERMKQFAYISMFEAILKLIAVVLLAWSFADRLVLYGFWMLLFGLVVQLIYIVYSRFAFEECRYNRCFDKAIFKQLASFAGWGLISGASGLLRNYGGNILINLFFGTVVNAARGISVQVNNALNALITNFMTALTPQITKAFATGQTDYLLKCVYKGSKFSFFSLYIFSLPVLMYTEEILSLWLVDVPDYTATFVRLMILFSLVDTLSRTTANAINATGDIKVFSIVVGGLNLMELPVSYMILRFCECSPEIIVWVSVIISVIGIVPRILISRKHIPIITFKGYAIDVVLPTILVGTICYSVAKFLKGFFSSDLTGVVASIFFMVLSTMCIVYIVGLKKEEKTYLRRKLRLKIERLR